jgi:cytochrome b6-f complex iron-sulfur subunit
MTTSTVLGLAAVAFLVLGAAFVFATTRSRDRGSAVGALSQRPPVRDGTRTGRREASPPGIGGDVDRAPAITQTSLGTLVASRPTPPLEQWVAPMDDGVTRREFFNRSVLALLAVGLAGIGGTSIAFLWPTLKGGFGTKIRAGKLDDILRTIHETKEPYYVPEGRFYLNPYPSEALEKAKKAYAGGVFEGMEAGVVALYQKCVHLGCRVPWCTSSQWFECPCHMSKYNRVGEKKEGPAPRGLDRFAISIDDGVVVVDTGALSLGPTVGTNTTGQEHEGPHCS